MIIRTFLTVCLIFIALPAAMAQQGGTVLYETDFSKAELNKPPADMMVLDGSFAVKQEGTERFLELAGAPLDSFGILFGTNQSTNVLVGARIYGTSRGQRQPVMGVGIGGAGGYKLLVAPGKRTIDIFRGDEQLASSPFTWENAVWTQFRLQVTRNASGGWLIEGKAWKNGSPEPANWQVSYKETGELPSGKAAVWGSPMSGTPIRFMDLKQTSR